MSNSLQTLQKKPVAGFDVARLREDFPILAVRFMASRSSISIMPLLLKNQSRC